MRFDYPRYLLFVLLSFVLVSCPNLDTSIDVSGNWNVILSKSTGQQTLAVAELQTSASGVDFSGTLTFTSLSTNGGTISGNSKTGDFRINEVGGSSYVDIVGKFLNNTYTGTYTSYYSSGVKTTGNIFMSKYVPVVSVSVQPSQVSVFVNRQHQFTATVLGTKNVGVTWAATCGIISATGQYTAPATPATCEVSAKSVQDPNKSSKSIVTVSKVPVSIAIQPLQASVYTNEQYSFSALVGEATDKSVVWTATCGVITASGQYTAPSTPQTCEVKVSSVEDPSKTAVAAVTVLGVVVGIEPQVAYLEATDPRTAVFTASIAGPNNKLVTWSTSQGTVQVVGNEATFQVPSGGDVFSITATSQLDPTKSATATVILKTPVGAGVWANVPNWFTYQANEQHTGFVPVTLNAKKFSKSWVQPFTRSLSPVVDGDGKFFVTSSDKKLYCLNASNGQIEWTKDFSTVDSLDPPAFSNGKVYVSSGGHSNTYLWTLNANDGTTLSRSPFGNQWSSNYAPTPFKGNVYISGGYYGGSYGFNATSGDQLWFIPLNQYDQWTPAVDDNYVYAYTGSYSPKLDVINRTTGVIEFSIADPNFDWGGWSMNLAPVIGSQNDILAIHNNRLIKFDLTNKKIAWELKSNFSGQVTVANGKIFALNNGEVQVRSEADGSLLWKWIPQGTTRADGTMVVVDNYVFVGAGDKTFAIDLNTQASVWEYNARGHLSLSNEGKLLIASYSGGLTAIDLR